MRRFRAFWVVERVGALLLVALFCTEAFAQSGGLPKIAVYVTGNLNDSEKHALGTEMLNALVKSGRFMAVERSTAFMAEIEREQATQRSGGVDDGQISRLGKQFGVQFVCIAGVAGAFGSHQVSARIIDVETAEVKMIGRASGQLNSMHALETLTASVINSMFGGAPILPIPPPQAASTQRQAAPIQAPMQPASAPTPNTIDKRVGHGRGVITEPQTEISSGAADIFFSTQIGMIMTTATLDAKGKVQALTRRTIKEVEGSGDNMVITIAVEQLNTWDKKPIPGRQPVEMKMNIVNGNYEFDALSHVSSGTIIGDRVRRIPIKMVPGDRIDDISVTHVMDIVPRGTLTTEYLSLDHQCVAIEDITVPAGTFRAYKVTSTVRVNSKNSRTGRTGKSIVTAVDWFVLGVGSVKGELITYRDNNKKVITKNKKISSFTTELVELVRVAPLTAQPSSPPIQAVSPRDQASVKIMENARASTPEVWDFTTGQRWGTGLLNWLIPGLGSFTIMKDGVGGWTQVGLSAGGYIFLLSGVNNNSEGLVLLGYGSALASGIYNIARSASYNRPGSQPTAAISDRPQGLNFAVFPDADGNLKAYATYSLEF